ncbi:MAG: carboxypeptidase regulatory-like domain-containing protein [Acidobacteriota bacterium]
MRRIVGFAFIAMLVVATSPVSALAQGSSAATITGAVKDASGAVLPGVTIDVATPDGTNTRNAVTDDKGEYRIDGLRSGAYTVTYSLSGFSTFKRAGLQLPPSFTATVNVELKVGGLAESVTVTGESPLIDTQNLTQQKTVSKELLDAVPTAKSMLGIASLMPAVVEPPNAQDVGGSKGERSVRLSVHGGKTSDSRLLQDGMRYNALTPGLAPFAASALEGTGRGYYINPLAAQEIVIDIGTMGSAEYEYGGAQVNTLPKDGGNRFGGSFFFGGTGHKLQADNLTSELQGLGLTTVNTVRQVYDINGMVAGPIVRNRAWFITSGRRWGTTTSVANLYGDANINARVLGAPAAAWRYAPDLNNPIYPAEIDKGFGGRVTVQATSKDKFTVSYDRQRNFQDQLTGQLETGTIKNEANAGYCQTHSVTQTTWNRPSSSKLLLDGGFTVSRFTFGGFGSDLRLSDYEGCGGGIQDFVSINDTGLGYTYNGVGSRTSSLSHQANGRFSLSYLPGAHQIKAGLFFMYGLGGGHRTYTTRTPSQVNGVPMSYTFNAGTPTGITVFAAPILTIDQLNPDMGVFVQDQWRLGRVTFNAGLRWDWIHESVPAISEEAGPLVGARSFAALDNVPNWKDVSPRFGMVWDPIGDGRTAVKVGINRYVMSNTTGIANAFDPANASVNSTTRSWGDTNSNFFPNCDLSDPAANGECGALANQSFGKFVSVTNPDPNWIEGYGKRPYNWQFGVSIDRELFRGMSVSAGYYRTWFGNFIVLDNLSVTSSDYTSYCVTAPTDARLPSNISGAQVCNLADINANKFGQVNNLATLSDNYGKQTEVYNGLDVSFNLRLPRRATIGGGLNVGNAVQAGTTAGGSSQSSTNNCYVIDSPQQLYNCDQRVPYQSRIKINGSVMLPYEVQLAAVVQSSPGPTYNATYTYTTAQAQTSLGRPLSGGVRTASINLLQPFSQYGSRINQFDLRASKIFSLGTRKLQANLDLYNLFNVSTVVNYNSTFGASWLQPTQILDARLMKLSVQLDF